VRTTLAVMLAAFAATSSAQAAQVLDQQNDVAHPLYHLVANDFSSGPPGQPPRQVDFAALQFVTAGISGKLTQVDLLLNQLNGTPGGGKLVIAKNVTFSDVGAVLTYTPLGSLGFGKNQIGGGYTLFDTSSLDISLNAGEQFVIALLPEQNGSSFIFGWGYGGNTYSGGLGYLGVSLAKPDDDNFNWFYTDFPPGRLIIPAHDHAFRTWMTPGSVPETSTWAMMIVGFGMAGAALRKRRTNVAFA